MTRKTKRSTIDEAISETMRAAGFATLAKEWMTRPEYRAEMVQMFTNILNRDSRFGPHYAARFTRLIAWRHAIKSHAGEAAA